jgi:putative endopeptidase
VPLFFSVGDGADAKDSSRSIAQAHQGGLGLPDRDYYFADEHAAVRTAYQTHVARMLQLAGDDEATAAEAAAAVVALETKLAGAQLTRTERRDPDKTYHLLTLSALVDAAPQLDWRAYFKALQKPTPGDINVDCPPAITAAAEAAKAATPAQLRAYQRWHVVNAAAEYLSDAFSSADFDFYLRTLSGQAEQKPRWKRCLGKVNGHLGEALGQLYVARAFPGDSKARAAAVVLAVRDALEARLKELPWLGEDTRQKALLKMKSFGVKIGYPDRWIDYSTLVIDPKASYFEMVLACNRFDHARSMERVDAPVDRSRWFMAPQVVNAYYSECPVFAIAARLRVLTRVRYPSACRSATVQRDRFPRGHPAAALFQHGG